MIGVYLIKSLFDDTLYVGATTRSFNHRFKGHIAALKAGTHSCIHLQRAYNKYGEDNFIFEPVVVLSKGDYIWDQEQAVWDYLSSQGERLYNIRPNGQKGYEFTDEHKRISGERLAKYNRSKKGLPTWNAGTAYIKTKVCLECGKDFEYNSQNRKTMRCSKACRYKNVSNKMKGRKLTEEHKKNLSVAKKGIPPSPQTIEALVKKLKGKPWSESRRISYENKMKESI